MTILALLFVGMSPAVCNEQRLLAEKIKLNDPGDEEPGFTLMDRRHHQVEFVNRLDRAVWLNNQNLLNGSGVAMGDFDRDGHCDIYLCSLSGGNRLYRNLGDWRFDDATSSPLACLGVYSTGAGFVDFNGDGWLDLLVLAMGSPNRLYLNDGQGSFNQPLYLDGNNPRISGSTSFAAGDLDGDSDLDLYITNYGYKSILKDGGRVTINKVNGRDVVTGQYANKIKIIGAELHEYGEMDDILINDGNGSFKLVRWKTIVEGMTDKEFPYRDQGLAVAFRDLDGDMAPELVVANDGHPDRFFRNNGKGAFRLFSSDQIRHLSFNSMGLDFADINRDTVDDLVIVEMLATGRALRITQDKIAFPVAEHLANRKAEARPQSGRNMLYMGRGDMTFAESAYSMGLAASDWSWSSVFLDVDLDGFEDLLVTNGFEYDADDWDMSTRLNRLKGLTPIQRKKSILLYPKLDTPNVAFRNRSGTAFESIGHQWGFDSLADGHGMACGDLDNDGDLDLVVNNLNSFVSIYRNNASSPRLAIELKRRGGNTSGTGSRLIVEGHKVTQSQEMISGGRYMSSDQPVRVFAAKRDSPHRVTVRWRSGQVSVLKGLVPGYRYRIGHPPLSSPDSGVSKTVEQSAMFHQGRVQHDRQTGLPIPPQQIQPGIPYEVRRMDPNVLGVDLDGESGMDLLVSDGQKGITAYLGDDRGGFELAAHQDWPSTGLAGGAPDLGGQVLALTRPPSLIRYSDGLLGVEQELEYPGEARAAVFLDYDSDGDSDLFVGGDALPGRYPIASRSALFENRSGRFVLLRNELGRFAHLSLVTGVASGDLDDDGTMDLVVAQEWGAIQVFLNRDGILEDATQEMGFHKYSGLWQCVHLADVNGDGRLDVVAGNFGANTVYSIYPLPVRLVYLDHPDSGVFSAFEFYHDKVLDDWFPTRKYSEAIAAFPLLAHRIPTSRRFASMNMNQILGNSSRLFKHREINFLNTAVFLNKGGAFSPRILPDSIQSSPVFGVCSGDFNRDGWRDLFFAQNFFGVPRKFSRYDAGQGSLMLGGQGGLSRVLQSDSTGIQLLGEQRSPVAIDFNRDGRLDIVLAERGNGVFLLENRITE